MKLSKLKLLLAGAITLSAGLNATASNFGTEKTYSQMYPPAAFQPSSDTNDYIIDETQLYCNGGTQNYRTAVHLPTGAKPVGMVAILRDNQAQNIQVALQRTCNGFDLPFGANTDLTTTQIIGLASSGNSGVRTYYSASATENHNVNNLRCAYTIRVDLNSCASTNHEFNRVALRYKRELTGVPATAPYDDVPASHPFAQHINAFKNAGITGGCGGGNFCPDDPLTRGQMAVFLSKALGLSWSDSNGVSIVIPPILP